MHQAVIGRSGTIWNIITYQICRHPGTFKWKEDDLDKANCLAFLNSLHPCQARLLLSHIAEPARIRRDYVA